MRGKKSAECFNLMSEAYFGLEAYKNVIESAEKVIEFAGDDKQPHTEGLQQQRTRASGLGGEKGSKETSGRGGCIPTGTRNGRRIAGSSLQPRCDAVAVESRPGRNRGDQAVHSSATQRSYVEQRGGWLRIRVARAKTMLPIFHSRHREGEHIALEDLRGKVVVLDFWGTWCPPCVESVPALRSLHKKILEGAVIRADRDQLRQRGRRVAGIHCQRTR